MKLGLGLITYNRPKFFRVCLDSVIKHLLDTTDVVCVYDDGSTAPEYEQVFADCPDRITVFRGPLNRGVAYGKNRVLRHCLDAGCDYMFTLEDDMEVLSPDLLTEYVAASQKSGYQHLNFAHHGPANEGRLISVDEYGLEIYLNCVGAFSMYTRQVIEECGYMDESFYNQWEHCLYAAEIARKGLCPPFWRFPDLPNSRNLIREQPDAITNSSIRRSPEWIAKLEEGRQRFVREYPEVWNTPYPEELQ